jgi:hypothetical protein
MSDFETIEIFNDYIAANFAKQKLQHHGINCYLADENTVMMQWTLSNAIGGIKLRVLKENKEKAIQILNEEEAALPVDHQIETDGKAELICPRCKSNNTATDKISKKTAAWTWLILGAPLPITIIKSHRCFYCGNQWET